MTMMTKGLSVYIGLLAGAGCAVVSTLLGDAAGNAYLCAVIVICTGVILRRLDKKLPAPEDEAK